MCIRDRYNGSCIACFDTNCTNCTNSASFCAQCADGYGVNTSDGACYACIGLCDRCWWNVNHCERCVLSLIHIFFCFSQAPKTFIHVDVKDSPCDKIRRIFL